jgi:multiple sugar transport system permease protein
LTAPRPSDLASVANADWGGAMAASIVASLPILIAFAIVQRSFIQGVTAGAVK